MERLPLRLSIPRLKDALAKILSDYAVQVRTGVAFMESSKYDVFFEL